MTAPPLRDILLQGSSRALELLATGSPLSRVLEVLVETAERVSPGMRCSVLLVDRERRRLRLGVGPNLPAGFNEAIDGLPIARGVGCCGECASSGERVIVADALEHPYTAPMRTLAEMAGIRACWSEPIRSAAGEILGTFASYYREPREPDERDLECIRTAAHLAGIAIERTRTLDALQVSEERYRTLFENAPEALMVYDVEEDRLVDLNANAERLFGRSRTELSRCSIAELSPPRQPDGRDSKAAARRYLEAAVAGRHPVFEWVHLHADGRAIPCEVRLVRLPAARRTLVRGSVTDISERRRIEAERAMLEEKVRQGQKLESLGVLAGGIAHDFNNLLVGILGNASLARAEVPPDSPVHVLLTDIETAAQRAAELAREMLAYSGKGRFVLEDVQVNDLVVEMSHLLESSIARRAAVDYALAPDLPAVLADATQIRQVVMNLITNASDAIGSGSGRIRISTGVADVDAEELARADGAARARPGRFVFVEVADQGCGMTPETMRRMFDPFFTTKFTGRGLGLAAVLGIVKGHEGAIQVRSRPGEGTTVRVLLPVSARPASPAGSAPPATSDSVEDWRGSETVLVVDDEPAVLSFVGHVLSRAGLRVLTAENGAEAVETFQAHAEEIDAVLLDLTMPVMGGEATFRRIRELRADVAIVLSSGFNERDAADRFAGLGLAGFLQKPYRVRTLLEVIRRAASGRETSRGGRR